MYNKTFIIFLNTVIYLSYFQNSVLFLCLQSGFTFLPLNTVKLISKEISQFFARTSQKFYSDEIVILPQKWQKVVEQNGTYLVNTLHLKYENKIVSLLH